MTLSFVSVATNFNGESRRYARFAELLGLEPSEGYFIRVLQYAGIHGARDGSIPVSRAKFGAVVLSRDWHVDLKRIGERVYDALLDSEIAVPLLEDPTGGAFSVEVRVAKDITTGVPTQVAKGVTTMQDGKGEDKRSATAGTKEADAGPTESDASTVQSPELLEAVAKVQAFPTWGLSAGETAEILAPALQRLGPNGGLLRAVEMAIVEATRAHNIRSHSALLNKFLKAIATGDRRAPLPPTSRSPVSGIGTLYRRALEAGFSLEGRSGVAKEWSEAMDGAYGPNVSLDDIVEAAKVAPPESRPEQAFESLRERWHGGPLGGTGPGESPLGGSS